jgi:RimJ/RimL family protein N-acetyltransferase
MNGLRQRVGASANRLVTFRRQYLFWRDTRDPEDPAPRELPEGFTFVFPVKSSDLADLELEGGERDARALQSYMANGERLAVILDGRRVACRGLVRSGGHVSLEGDRRARELDDGQVFIHYCRTSSDDRGRGLYPLVLSRILDSLRSDGETTAAFISCHINNVPSVKGIARAGFSIQHTTQTVGLLGGRIAITRFGAPSPVELDMFENMSENPARAGVFA